MSWEVEYTDEFGDWWNALNEAEQDTMAAQVLLLEQLGPHLGFPHSSGITGSKHSHCVNFASNTRESLTGFSMRSILDAWRSCSLGVRKQVMTVGMIPLSHLLISFTMNI